MIGPHRFILRPSSFVPRPSSIVLVLGAFAWGLYSALLSRRSLHMLQLEGYLTARFLRWWLARPFRLMPPQRAAVSLSGLLLGLLAGRRSGPLGILAAAAWAVLGFALAARTRWLQAKKPLVLTARATRLAVGQTALGLGLVWVSVARGQGPGARIRGSGFAAGRLASMLSLSTFAAPLLAAAANLLLFPLEEALRRYYLRDAAAKLRRLNPIVVAVAGSYGKTSTKEFIATILSDRYSVLKPPGSYNTPMGLARVIREQLQPVHQVFVAELGDWSPGDIALLCRVLRPQIGVLTTIGPEHLERFGSMERVEASKFELLAALPSDGTAVVNQDDEAVRRLGDQTPVARVVRYGLQSDGVQVRARAVQVTRNGSSADSSSPAGLEFVVQAEGHGEATFNVGVLGRHNVENLLAAAAVGLSLGLSLEEIARAAGRIRPVEHRLQPIAGEGGVLIIDDAFNSNPRGAKAALEVLSEIEAGQRILVTPGMVELAELEFEANRHFGRQAARTCDEVIVVGRERSPALVAGLRDEGFAQERLHVVADLAEATTRLRTLVKPGDVVLFENDLPDTYADLSGPEPAGGSVGVHPGGPSPNVVSETEIHPVRPRDFLELDGVRLAYHASGEATVAPPVVLLHGWGADADALSLVQSCLEPEFRVIAFDLPGFGQSDPPPAAWDSNAYAELIGKGLERLGLSKVSLIGHSFGGKIAIVLAARWPERVPRLVLVDSAGIRHTRSPAYRARVAAFKVARRLVGRGPMGELLAGRFGSVDYRRAGQLRPTLVRVVNEDLVPLLRSVKAPTLLIWGDQDRETPLSDAAIMERELTDAGLVVFQGAGHFPYADDPPRFCRVVANFLKAD
jgi:UDP-N-acetylmuramoyl-tripeptide--D-alanyl-D-alanine ligase